MACHSPRHLLNNHLWPTLSFYPHLAIFTGWGWLRYLWRCFSGSLASSPFYSLVSARCIFSLKAHQPGLVNSIFACWCNTNNYQFPVLMRFPGLASHLRKALLPVHIFTGLAVFILAAVTALLGITEKAIFRFGINPKTRRLLTWDFFRDKDKEFSYKVRYLYYVITSIYKGKCNLANNDNEQDGGGEATVVNLLGLSIVVFVVLILAIVTRQSFRF